MLKKEDYIFTIGYDGLSAIVDGRAKKQYGKLGTMELAERGLYRAACCSAYYALQHNDPTQMESFITFFNKKAKTSFTTAEEIMRLFGISDQKVTKSIVL